MHSIKEVLKHSFSESQINLTITNMSDKQSSHSSHCHRSGAEQKHAELYLPNGVFQSPKSVFLEGTLRFPKKDQIFFCK